MRRSCAASLAAALLAAPLGLLSSAPAITADAPVDVDAVYKITLNGFNIGSLHFSSSASAGQYVAVSEVELSALLGAFHWKGVTRASGTMNGKAVQPAGFLFQFDGSLKSGSVKMGFGGANVQSISVQPPASDPPDMVPLGPQHLKGVLDPLTAIMVMTHTSAATPCGRKVPIFDGKQRFDLDLTYRRQAPLGANGDMAIVCRIKYVPIAGYRANEETRNLANSTGIEIAFRPVPRAGLMLPQLVVVPTLAGPAEITLQHVEIKTPELGQIALVE